MRKTPPPSLSACKKEHLSTAHGVVTRITLPDGFRMTFLGPMGKREAIRQAVYHRAKGHPSE